MAHFAKLDENNVVTAVVVVNNDALDPEREEQSGIEFLNSLYVDTATWVQTSYNHKFRKQYAGINFIYDSVANVFIAPKPFPSWTLDENHDWQAPVAKPNDGLIYQWNEELGEWELYEQEIPLA
jgi:hypothetical protein